MEVSSYVIKLEYNVHSVEDELSSSKPDTASGANTTVMVGSVCLLKKETEDDEEFFCPLVSGLLVSIHLCWCVLLQRCSEPYEFFSALRCES
jgi:hypothetical protein